MAAGTQRVVKVALDISTAFDTLDHTTLINRLEHAFGITGVALRWIISYVSKRSQFVAVVQSKSNVTRCEFGVLQGSVFGPILVTLYVAPVANVISCFCVSHHQYADDSKLYIATDRDNIQIKLDLLRDGTSAVNDWFLLNGLSLNPDKSDILLLGTAAKPRTIGTVEQVSVAGVSINTTDSIKNLGVFLDSGLTFNKHVVKVCQSSYFHILARRRIRGSLSPEFANTVACAIVGARLDYCNSILYGTSKYLIYSVCRIHLHVLLQGRTNLTTSHQCFVVYTGFQSNVGSSTKWQYWR